MRTVHEVSRLTGVSVRTLHHYDAIGLLKPAKVTRAGYRLYDDAALRRLQSILLFRELQFPLKEIRAILDNPAFDPAQALAQQIELLELQRRRLGELIAFARELQQKGDDFMDFTAFDKTELEQYAAEAKARWGATDAYREFEQRQAAGADPAAAAPGLMACFAALGGLRGQEPDAAAVQQAVAALQRFITEHYYHCTDDILAGLGQMYAADERFAASIDRAGGAGTADFAARAIAAYCAARR